MWKQRGFFNKQKYTEKSIWKQLGFFDHRNYVEKSRWKRRGLSINKITSKKYVEMMWKFKLKSKKFIVLDDMVPDLLRNKKLQLVITELFVRCRNLNIFLALITQSYFAVQKNIRLNSTYYFVMKIPNKQELQKIAINHS